MTPTDLPNVESLHDRVRGIIDSMRPLIQSDGGDIDLVSVSDAGVVSVRFRGACVGCPSCAITLRQGIEHNIKLKIPEVTQVVALP